VPGLVQREDLGAHDVGGHQVRRELDAPEPQVEQFRDGGDQQGLGETGNAHEEAVAPGEHRQEHLIDDLLHAHDARGQPFAEAGGGGGDGPDVGGGHAERLDDRPRRGTRFRGVAARAGK
jgi:hypothetical protein